MINIVELDPIIQLTIKYLTNPKLSFQSLANEQGITKQAIWKKVMQGISFLKDFKPQLSFSTNKQIKALQEENEVLKKENGELKELNLHLKRQLIIKAAQTKSLLWFQAKVLGFLPRFKLGRLEAYQKKALLDLCEKFRKAGGRIKDFCKAIKYSPETILRWMKAYEAHGINGLENKKTRPKNFGNKVPLWVKQQLIALFLRFPYWTNYQYHKYIRFNPTTNWYVSLQTISKLKNSYARKTEEEKDRQKKRWCFKPGTDVWTVDFTCILKTDKYKLQLLTVSDARSRFSFETALFLETSTDIVVDHLQDLFIKYGKPRLIKADNGPEFRMDCREKLEELSVYLLNSPQYYGQFNGAHERIHKTLKNYISAFNEHKNITRLVDEIKSFFEEYNYQMPHEYLNGKTPADVYFSDEDIIPEGAQLVEPYEKDGELRLKFTNRNGNPARLSIPIIQR